jgi:hypothetical protein
MISKKRLGKNYSDDPIQYTRCIFSSSANKAGELHRIKIFGIDIGSFLTKYNL